MGVYSVSMVQWIYFCPHILIVSLPVAQLKQAPPPPPSLLSERAFIHDSGAACIDEHPACRERVILIGSRSRAQFDVLPNKINKERRI
jgi:hypothetical protein